MREKICEEMRKEMREKICEEMRKEICEEICEEIYEEMCVEIHKEIRKEMRRHFSSFANLRTRTYTRHTQFETFGHMLLPALSHGHKDQTGGNNGQL